MEFCVGVVQGGDLILEVDNIIEVVVVFCLFSNGAGVQIGAL